MVRDGGQFGTSRGLIWSPDIQLGRQMPPGASRQWRGERRGVPPKGVLRVDAPGLGFLDRSWKWFCDELALCGGTLSRCSARLGQEGAVCQLVWILQETSIATASPSHLILVKRHHLSPGPEVAQPCFSPFLPCDPIHLQPGFQARRVWMGQMACWDGGGQWRPRL